MSAAADTRRLALGRIEVALHTLAAGDGAYGPPLLLLHALGESADAWRSAPPPWPGSIYALDFVGHGASDPLRGGAYFPEYLATTVDAVLAAIGDRAALAGAGIGAYVALLVAGARPERVPAALLLPGEGFAGGGALPDFGRPERDSLEAFEASLAEAATRYAPGTDPMVCLLERDARPVAYAGDFAAGARRLLLCELGAAGAAPDWWVAVQRSPRAVGAPADRDAAFAALARAARA